MKLKRHILFACSALGIGGCLWLAQAVAPKTPPMGKPSQNESVFFPHENQFLDFNRKIDPQSCTIVCVVMDDPPMETKKIVIESDDGKSFDCRFDYVALLANGKVIRGTL